MSQQATPSTQRFNIIMPRVDFPTTCGRKDCSHLQCERWRQQARTRCSECERLIHPGEKLIEYRNPQTKALISQQHEVCPK